MLKPESYDEARRNYSKPGGLFWKLPGVYSTAVGYAGGITPNPSYQEVCSGRTGHTEAVLVVFDPAVISYDQLLKAFWEGHNPTQGMRQGNDVGTQYRSGIYTDSDEQLAAAKTSRDLYQDVLTRGGVRRDHHRDPAGAHLLLRRGLPPAVPGEEPGRLLRPRRHRAELPGRPRRDRDRHRDRHRLTHGRRLDHVDHVDGLGVGFVGGARGQETPRHERAGHRDHRGHQRRA